MSASAFNAFPRSLMDDPELSRDIAEEGDPENQGSFMACQSCNTPWGKHVGIMGTCEQLRSAITQRDILLEALTEMVAQHCSDSVYGGLRSLGSGANEDALEALMHMGRVTIGEKKGGELHAAWSGAYLAEIAAARKAQPK